MSQVDALLLKWPAPVQTTRRLAWALAYQALYSGIDLTTTDLSPDDLAAEATRRSFLYEARANELVMALKEACDRGL